MAQLVALCAGLVLCALGCTGAAEAVEVGPCPRPSDQYRCLRHETVVARTDLGLLSGRRKFREYHAERWGGTSFGECYRKGF